MPLPSPVGEHWNDTPVSFSSGLTVTFRHGLIAPEVREEIEAAGLKRAADRIGDRFDDDGDPIPVTPRDVTIEDVAEDFFDAAMIGFYTSEDSTLQDWDRTETETLLGWPDGMQVDLYLKVDRFARSGRVADPKAE